MSSAAVIEAGTSDTKATLSVVGYAAGAPISFVDYLRFQLRGEAPVSTKGSTDDVDIGTTSGLTAGASLHGEISGIWWPDLKQDVVKNMQAFCHAHFQELVGDMTLEEIAFSGSSDTCANATFFRPGAPKTIVDRFNAKVKRCNDPASVLQEAEKPVCMVLLKHTQAFLTPKGQDNAHLATLVKEAFDLFMPTAPR
jgi:hypothetical protein